MYGNRKTTESRHQEDVGRFWNNKLSSEVMMAEEGGIKSSRAGVSPNIVCMLCWKLIIIDGLGYIELLERKA